MYAWLINQSINHWGSHYENAHKSGNHWNWLNSFCTWKLLSLGKQLMIATHLPHEQLLPNAGYCQVKASIKSGKQKSCNCCQMAAKPKPNLVNWHQHQPPPAAPRHQLDLWHKGAWLGCWTNCSVNCRQRIRKVPKKLQQMGQQHQQQQQQKTQVTPA